MRLQVSFKGSRGLFAAAFSRQLQRPLCSMLKAALWLPAKGSECRASDEPSFSRKHQCQTWEGKPGKMPAMALTVGQAPRALEQRPRRRASQPCLVYHAVYRLPLGLPARHKAQARKSSRTASFARTRCRTRRGLGCCPAPPPCCSSHAGSCCSHHGWRSPLF